MGIALSGTTESNGNPVTYYRYQYEVFDRTVDSVHFKLYVQVRMRDRSNYFSFQIGHETKVFGGSMSGSGKHQFAWIKKGRDWWGHQGSVGDGWLWTVGSWDYYGDNWHGWYTVFDGIVPIGIDDDRLYVVPVITRPPCKYNRYSFDGEWTPRLDVTCWEGQTGYWRPWGKTEWSSSGSSYWYYSDHTAGQDMAFGNNKSCKPLMDKNDGRDGIYIGTYDRPADVVGSSITPSKIDVAEQDDEGKTVTVKWNAANLATGYEVAIMRDADNPSPFSNVGGVSRIVDANVSGTSISFNPKAAFFGGTNWRSKGPMEDGDRFYVAVRSHDKEFVTSRNFTVLGPIEYFEVKSSAPSDCFIVGRNGKRNELLFKGETARIYYSGEKDGSYPIAQYCLRRQDGKELRWDASETLSSDSIGSYVTKAVAGWSVPNASVSFELRAYNTRGGEVCLGSYNESGSGPKWFSFSVWFYGGIMYVWGKKSYDGDDAAYSKLGAAGWHEGLARVWGKRYWLGNEASYRALGDEPAWHEAELVYVWDGSRWRSM